MQGCFKYNLSLKRGKKSEEVGIGIQNGKNELVDDVELFSTFPLTSVLIFSGNNIQGNGVFCFSCSCVGMVIVLASYLFRKYPHSSPLQQNSVSVIANVIFCFIF